MLKLPNCQAVETEGKEVYPGIRLHSLGRIVPDSIRKIKQKLLPIFCLRLVENRHTPVAICAIINLCTGNPVTGSAAGREVPSR